MWKFPSWFSMNSEAFVMPEMVVIFLTALRICKVSRHERLCLAENLLVLGWRLWKVLQLIDAIGYQKLSHFHRAWRCYFDQIGKTMMCFETINSKGKECSNEEVLLWTISLFNGVGNTFHCLKAFMMLVVLPKMRFTMQFKRIKYDFVWIELN